MSVRREMLPVDSDQPSPTGPLPDRLAEAYALCLRQSGQAQARVGMGDGQAQRVDRVGARQAW